KRLDMTALSEAYSGRLRWKRQGREPMTYDAQKQQFAEEGYAVFEGLLRGELLDLLRDECAAFVAREDARMDAAGVDTLGISHRGKRYFANECQREQPALRRMLFSEVMADVCRATL